MDKEAIYFWIGAFLSTFGFSIIHMGLGFAWVGLWCLFFSYSEFVKAK